MGKVKCFNVVEELIVEGNKQFAPFYIPNAENVRILSQHCHAIDILCNDFDGESIEVEIDDIQLTIQIAIECHKILFNHKLLHTLKERALNLEIIHLPDEDGLFRITFVFPPVWDSVDKKELLKNYLRQNF